MRAAAAAVVAALLAAGCSVQWAPAQRPASHARPATPSQPAEATLALRITGGFDVSPSPSPAPPDAAVAVGPSSVLTADNAQVRLQDRAGTKIASAYLRDLFGPAHLSPAELQTDPRAVYDAGSGRFVVAATTHPAVNCIRSACPTGVLLAVSTSSAPPDLSAQSWHAWDLPGWAPGAAPSGQYLDFPGLSVSSEAIVLTVNVVRMTPTPGILPTTLRIRVVDKAAAVSGALTVPWADVDQPRDDTGSEIQDLQPAAMASGASAVPMFLVGAAPAGIGACRIIVAAVGGSPTAPTLTTRSAGSRLGCAGPPLVQQPGGAKPLADGGYGLSSRPFYRDGQLWFARTVGNGLPGGQVAEVHWGELDVRGWPAPPAFVQESLLGAEQSWAFFPALTLGAGGAVVIVFARSSASEPPSLYVSGRLPSDAGGTLRAPILARAGMAAQVLSGANNRYGDYFDATPDPTDQTVWVFGEYTLSATMDGMWLAHVT